MKITHEHMWEDLIDLYHLNDKTRQCMEYICDRSYPDLTDGLSDDKYNAYMYAQYLESAMQTLERSDALSMNRRSDTAQAFSLVINTLAEILLCHESEVKRLTKENEEMKNRIQDLTENKSHRLRVMENTSE